MDHAATQNVRGSSNKKITISSINSCLLSALVLFFGSRNIYSDVPSCSDVIENIYYRGKLKCGLPAEKYRIAAVGQQVFLDCSTCRNQSGTVDWWYRKESNYFNKTVLITNGDHERVNRETVFFLANDDASLIINNVRYNDAGLYTCVCNAGFGDRTTTYLKVRDYVAVNNGSSAALDCYSSPMSDVEWSYKSSKDAQARNVYSNGFVYDDFERRFSLPRSSKWNFSLVIRRVQLNDSGYYTCHEESEISSIGHTILLITSVRIVPGEPEISLPCWPSVESKVDWMVWPLEHFNVLWASKTIYEGGRVSENFRDRFSVGPSNGSLKNYTLTIKQVKTSDTGVYACVERGGFGDYHYIQLVVSNETDDVNDKTTPRESESGSNNSSNQTTETAPPCEGTESKVYALLFICVILGLTVVTISTIMIARCYSRKGQNAVTGKPDDVLL